MTNSKTFVPFITAVQLTDTKKNSPSKDEALAMFPATSNGDGSRMFASAVIETTDTSMVVGWPGNEAWTAPVVVNVGDWVASGGTVWTDAQISTMYVPLNSVKNASPGA